MSFAKASSSDRWDRDKPPHPNNLILLTSDEAEEHDQNNLQALTQKEPEFVTYVRNILDLVSDAFGVH